MNTESKITLLETERKMLKELYEDGMDYANKLEICQWILKGEK